MTALGGTVKTLLSLKIWRADLDLLSSALEPAELALGLLSPSEKSWDLQPLTAAPQLDHRRHRRLARIALRLLLHKSGATDAAATELSLGPHGKPALPSAALAFNLAHTRGLALIAVAPQGPVGIDFEMDRPAALGTDRRALIVAAGHGLTRHPMIQPSPESADTITAFLRAWTRLEAFAKARGTGIGTLLTDLGITAAGVRHLTLPDAHAGAAALLASSGLALADLDLSPGSYGAVAAPTQLMAMPPAVVDLSPTACQLSP